MIHWDWVWTITIIGLIVNVMSAFFSGLTDILKKERLLAEADLERAKRERLLVEKGMRFQ